MRYQFLSLISVMLLSCALVGCGRSERYSQVSPSDPALVEFADMLQVDRAKLGLPDLPKKTDLWVERSRGGAYDVMLHLHSRHQQRTIAFRRSGQGLIWIHEQVIVEGPAQHTTPDGTFNEQIVLTHETSRVAGTRANVNTTRIMYTGPDQSLYMRSDLTYPEVQPTIDAWLARP